MTVPKPGIYRGVPFNEYLQWPAISASFLKDMEHTPHYAKVKADNPAEEKDCYTKGRLFHCLALEPEKADALFIIKPPTYTSEKGEEKSWNGNANVCKAWMAANADRTIVSADVYREAKAMADRVRGLTQMAPFLADADAELSGVYQDAPTGLTCKFRFDAFKNGIILDLKSTSGAAGREAFTREAQSHRYYIQVAHYIEAVKSLGLSDGVPWFAFVAVEGYAPHDVAVYDVQDDPGALSYDFLVYARIKRAMALQQTRWCMEHNEWPGYQDNSFDMELSYQARNEMELLTGAR